MTAYLIARVEVHDMDRYGEYMRHTPRVVAQYGGRIITRGVTPLTLEGEPETLRNVVIEFPGQDEAVAFFRSPEYARCSELRQGASTGQFMVLDGFPEEDWGAALAASSELSFD